MNGVGETARSGKIPVGAAPARGADRLRIAAFIAAAFVLRLVLGARDDLIFNDGPHFIDIARAFNEGQTRHALSHVYHPLYSWLMAKAYPLLGDYERAGLVVSALAGALVGIPLWLFFRRLFGRRIAWTALVLWAFHPFAVRYAANVQSDSVFLLFFTAGVAVLWRALTLLPKWKGVGMFPVVGVCAGLAYLTRPEGVGLAALGGFWILLGFWPRPGARLRPEFFPRALAAVLLVAGFLIIAYPYLNHIHQSTGIWQLTQKKSVLHLVGVGEQKKPSWAEDTVMKRIEADIGRPPIRRSTTFERYVGRGARMLVGLAEALTWQLVPFLLLGLAVRGRALWRTRGDLYLLSFIALYGLTIYRLVVTLGYGSKRHLFTLALLALGWTALGLVSLGPRLEAFLARRGLPLARRSAALLLAAAVVSLLPMTLAINAGEGIGERLAGEWIRDHTGAGSRPLVFAPRERITYYAGARFLPVPVRFSYDAVVAYVRGYGADFVVTYDGSTESHYPQFTTSIRAEDLELTASFPVREGSEQFYRVYRVLYPEGRPAAPPQLPRRMWRGESP
ncbi:MAG: glycosyltransferase family 39 protein [Deltaproteobacteria bacterium]|nr:glycosyltransferase family 39 protein [Deltaproteobacteria bacterium]